MSVEFVGRGAAIRRRREEGLFWITRQILRADEDSQRAAILLRVPDVVLSSRAEELAEACQVCQFADGAAYVAVRASATSATRDERGLLPADQATQLERWRRGMVAIAATADRDEIAGWIDLATTISEHD